MHPILSKKQFIKYAIEMAKIVKTLNIDVGVVHYNMLPKNWMIRETGEFVLSGFTKAKIIAKVSVWIGKLS